MHLCRFCGIMGWVMYMEKELPKRKKNRLEDYDYNSCGAYFITICTENRRQMLSRIVGGDVLGAPKQVELLPHGQIADKYIKQLNDFYDQIQIMRYVIMPNHIHILFFVVEDNGAPRTSPPTRQHFVAKFVSTFKRFCNKEYGENIWQRNYYDHIIRNREDYAEHAKYIFENPMRWYCDELCAENKGESDG